MKLLSWEFFSVLKNIENWPFYHMIKIPKPRFSSFGVSTITLLLIILLINVAYFWNRLFIAHLSTSHLAFLIILFLFIFEIGSLEVNDRRGGGGGAQGLQWIASLHVLKYLSCIAILKKAYAEILIKIMVDFSKYRIVIDYFLLYIKEHIHINYLKQAVWNDFTDWNEKKL